jgi:hypothetical protein
LRTATIDAAVTKSIRISQQQTIQPTNTQKIDHAV